LAVLSLVVAGIGGFSYLHKSVTLNVDGQLTHTSTLALTVGDFLQEQAVNIQARDQVQPATDAVLPRGGEVVIHRAKPLDLQVDGALRRVWTTATTVDQALAEIGVSAADVALSVEATTAVSKLTQPVAVLTPRTVTVRVDDQTLSTDTTAGTVAEALNDLGVAVGQNDQISVSLDATTSDGQVIEVTRAESSDGTKTVTTKYKTIKKNDASMLKGDQKVVQKGRAGERIITYRKTVVDGDVVDKEILAEVVVAEPQDEIIKVGTKEPPKPKVSAPNVNIKVSPSSAQGIARTMVADDDQFRCLVALWNRESGWNTHASNPYSGAYGIPQALPGSKMASAGADWRTNPRTQIKWGLGYIKGRYGSPCGAWAAFQSKGWY
jgi:uncharacterized protein YabE (DUF348 family)